jgi:hypothetical protein
MPNTNVYTGLDGSLGIAVESGPEGDLAKDISETFAVSQIGRATGVSIQVDSEMRPFHEIGQRYATELRPGNVNVSGTIKRAHINGALLKLMLGDGAGPSRPAGGFISPTFNLSLRMENNALPGNSSTITVHGVKLDGWRFDMPEDDFVLEEVGFKALWISTEDAEA